MRTLMPHPSPSRCGLQGVKVFCPCTLRSLHTLHPTQSAAHCCVALSCLCCSLENMAVDQQHQVLLEQALQQQAALHASSTQVGPSGGALASRHAADRQATQRKQQCTVVDRAMGTSSMRQDLRDSAFGDGLRGRLLPCCTMKMLSRASVIQPKLPCT